MAAAILPGITRDSVITIARDQLKLTGFIASVDGSRTLKESIIGPVHECEHLGCELAERLLRNGGKEILEEVYQREIGSK